MLLDVITYSRGPVTGHLMYLRTMMNSDVTCWYPVSHITVKLCDGDDVVVSDVYM